MSEDPKKVISCSFCGLGRDQVSKIVAGPGSHICDECIDLCCEIIGSPEQRRQELVGQMNRFFSNLAKSCEEDGGISCSMAIAGYHTARHSFGKALDKAFKNDPDNNPLPPWPWSPKQPKPASTRRRDESTLGIGSSIPVWMMGAALVGGGALYMATAMKKQ